jgi:hypothetical protein
MVRQLGKRQLPPPRLWIVAVADALAILVLFLSAGRSGRRIANSLGMVGLLCLVVSCGSSSAGGGGGSGGGGGGGSNSPVPTSLTLSTSALKQPIGTLFTLSATVSSTKPVTGWVTFLDSGVPFAYNTVANGTAQIMESNIAIGTHVFTAQYQGDANNQPSNTSGSLNQVITGNALINLIGSTGVLTHSMYITVVFQ